jgi:hypothetical protein
MNFSLHAVRIDGSAAISTANNATAARITSSSVFSRTPSMNPCAISSAVMAGASGGSFFTP